MNDEGMTRRKCLNKPAVPWSVVVIRHLGFIGDFATRHSLFDS